MECPFCHHKCLKVIDSRETSDMNAIKRRRMCLECLRRFTTFETIELIVQVLKRDGRYEDFQQQKLIKGLDAACRHTGISHNQVTSIATQITDELMIQQMREVNSKEIGEMVMSKLKELDPIAYIRFACVYLRFKDIEELMDEVKMIRPKNKKSVKIGG